MIKANGEGLIPAGPDGQEFLSLRTSEELPQSLEIREFGRPLALGTVIVGEHILSVYYTTPDSYSLATRTRQYCISI